MIIFLFIVVCAIIVFSIAAFKDRGQGDTVEKKRSRMEKAIEDVEIKHLTYDRQAQNGIAINKEETKIFILHPREYVGVAKIIDYADILQVHIIEDEHSTVTTSRTSQLAGVAIGSLAAGSLGAMIGGLSAKQVNNKDVKEIKLQVVVNNIDDPIIEYKVVNFQKKISVKDELYKQNKEAAMKWLKRIEVLIKRADLRDKEEAN